MERRRLTIIAASSAFAVSALVATLIQDNWIGRPTMVSASEPAICAAPDQPMNETLSRMFALMSTDTIRLATCWTARKADPAELSRYVMAGSPTTFWIENEHSRGRDGVLFAAVLISARWEGSIPQGWESSFTKVVVMRQQRDWSWTIDAIRPRTVEAMRDPHCGVCHR